MFAGHDTTTSTVSFMFYELARHPRRRRAAARRAGRQLPRTARAAARRPRPLTVRRAHRARAGARGDAPQVPARLGRPAARGRAVRVRRPHRAPRAPSSTTAPGPATTCPTSFTEPEEFRPERFTPEARAALPKGAYVPFGGGSRTCIGMRFGQLEVRTIATLILSRFTLSLRRGLPAQHPPDAHDQPQGGLPMIVHARATAARGRSVSGWPESARPRHPALAGPGPETSSAQARPIVSR